MNNFPFEVLLECPKERFCPHFCGHFPPGCSLAHNLLPMTPTIVSSCQYIIGTRPPDWFSTYNETLWQKRAIKKGSAKKKEKYSTDRSHCFIRDAPSGSTGPEETVGNPCHSTHTHTPSVPVHSNCCLNLKLMSNLDRVLLWNCTESCALTVSTLKL